MRNVNAGAHLLVKPVMFLIACDADHLHPLVLVPAIVNPFSNHILRLMFLGPIFFGETLVDNGNARAFGISVALSKRTPGQERDADGVEVSWRRDYLQYYGIRVFRPECPSAFGSEE